MNKNRLNGAAKLDLVARVARLFASPDPLNAQHGHGISQHTVPTGLDPDRWIARHTGPNYAARRRVALARRTRNRRKLRNRMSTTQLTPALNRPYARPANRKAAN